MTPKHAVILMALCSDYDPGQIMRGALLLDGLIDNEGKLTLKAYYIVREHVKAWPGVGR